MSNVKPGDLVMARVNEGKIEHQVIRTGPQLEAIDEIPEKPKKDAKEKKKDQRFG